jgi:hypothetical protein
MDLPEVLKGIEFIWNNKFDEAETLFAAKKTKSPRYALHYAEVFSCFYRRIVNGMAGSVFEILHHRR